MDDINHIELALIIRALEFYGANETKRAPQRFSKAAANIHLREAIRANDLISKLEEE